MSSELISSVEERLSRSYDASEVIVIEAPPGYGKSTSVPLLASRLYEKGLSRSLIHVLPLRAIVSDIYRNFYLAALCSKKEDFRLRLAREALLKMGISTNDVAYQMCMDLMLREQGDESCSSSTSVRKSPAFDALAIVSTLDSFAYNVMRSPVIDSFRSVKRYAILRARIFVSSVFLDEAHMIMRYPDDESAGKMLCFLKKLIEYCLSARVPLVVMSATLGEWFKRKLGEWSHRRMKVFTIGPERREGNHTIVLRDESFIEWARSIDWKTELVSEGDVVRRARDLALSGRKVLIVRDTVRDAVENYKALLECGVDASLIHGQLTLGDRALAIRQIEELQKMKGHGFVVVATPVVEAGVNWDFDVAFRDATNTFSLVQVAGRVCRSTEKTRREGEVYLIASEKCNWRLVEFVKRVKNEGAQINWKIPFDCSDGCKVYGYGRMIDLQEGLEEFHEEGEDVYEVLFFSFMLPSTNIRALEEEMNYSLLREPLAHFFVGKPEELLEQSPDDVINRTAIYSLNLLKKLRKSSVTDFAAVGIHGEESAKDSNLVVLMTKTIPENPREFNLKSRELIRSLILEHDADPLFVCYVVDVNAYEERIGFRIGGDL